MAKNPPHDNDFMKGALIPKFNSSKVPKLTYQQDCNDDLRLGSFEPNRFVWSGLQKKGASPLIGDPQDYIDHILRDTRAIFPLTVGMPLPEEITESLTFLMFTEHAKIIEFRGDQILRLSALVKDCQATQETWNLSIPTEIKGPQKKFKAVAFRQLLSNFSLGWDRWISQFTFGFPTTGILSQEGVFPASENLRGRPLFPQYEKLVKTF